jgi:hypothetical protein
MQIVRISTGVQASIDGRVPGKNADLLLPDVCPICHHAIAPVVALAFRTADGDAEVLIRCMNSACQRGFVALCQETKEQAPSGTTTFKVASVAPRSVEETPFPDVVKRTSPTFVAIYGQAMEAESHDLHQLVGIGLRKALEFLVKDYLIARKPNDRAEIEKTMLGPCIKKFVDDTRLKQCAERAAWLGNDETHYVRKWTDKDVNDLKTLIRLTVLWIEHIELTEAYLSGMTTAGPQPPPAGTP